MKIQRGSGTLVHPTSFPGPFGIGDLGPGALAVLNFLAAGKQRYWQVLPLHPTGYGNSPYATLSAFAGNPLLISPELLWEQGLFRSGELEQHPMFASERVDYGAVITWKLDILKVSFARFKEQSDRCTLREQYQEFCRQQRDWLDDYALFAALKDLYHGAAWTDWDSDLAARDPEAMAVARRTLADQIEFQQYLQFWFFTQWAALRRAAQESDIAIIGDVPIFIAHDSADVWAARELFQLDARGYPAVVAGVPPDYFSSTGQRWGSPLYRWDVLRDSGYAWWIERVRRALELVDIIRLDHFRGFHKYWEIPANEETAEHGRWVPGPGEELFAALRKALGGVSFLAEDLGYITSGVNALRERLDLPGMRVLQFAFGTNAGNHHLPHHYTRDVVVYTGTHDNDTIVGWWENCNEHERRQALRYLHTSGSDIGWDMIRLALASVAEIAVFPLQDILGLGNEARMNCPSTSFGNWEWRVGVEQLQHQDSRRLADLCTTYGR